MGTSSILDLFSYTRIFFFFFYLLLDAISRINDTFFLFGFKSFAYKLVGWKKSNTIETFLVFCRWGHQLRWKATRTDSRWRTGQRGCFFWSSLELPAPSRKVCFTYPFSLRLIYILTSDQILLLILLFRVIKATVVFIPSQSSWKTTQEEKLDLSQIQPAFTFIALMCNYPWWKC